MNEAHIAILSARVDVDGLRLIVSSREDDEESAGVVVIPLAQMEDLLDAVALGMRFRKIIGQA